MRTLIVYDSPFGNTAQIAQRVAAVLEPFGPVSVADVQELAAPVAAEVDLLVVGGPTQWHRMSPAMRTWLEGVPRHGFAGAEAAAFDTRYHQAAWLTGSAAGGIAHALRKKGAHMAVPPESFFMAKDVPPQGEKRRHELEHLEAGELERARAWAANLAQMLAAATPYPRTPTVPGC
jgi:flavodoxin